MPTPVVLALTKLPCQGTPLLKRHQNLAAKTIGSPKGLSSSRFWRVPASLRARAGLGARCPWASGKSCRQKGCGPHNRSLAIDQICLLLSTRDITLHLVRRNSEACPLIRLAIIFFLRYKCRLSLPLFIETRTCL